MKMENRGKTLLNNKKKKEKKREMFKNTISQMDYNIFSPRLPFARVLN